MIGLAAGNSGKEPQCPRGLAKANQAVLALPPCAKGWRGDGGVSGPGEREEPGGGFVFPLDFLGCFPNAVAVS